MNLVLVGRLSPEPRDAGVPDELVVGARGDVVDVLGGQLPQEGHRRPRVVAVEQLRFQFRAPRRVVRAQPVIADSHGATTGSTACGLASGRRRYSGTSGCGGAVQSTTRTRPDTVG